ncbi:SMI1/KNR4 family protein [Lentibacillus populi]|uniref:SMI1/KNR4 family protein n=1 Tax=Lentibacillus populi TaxID=1827502 RepID=A0A9W5TVX6_9BACI|nr:SMI1/KNR4 family protein [Lentibacillus populi]GGB37188.1 SMI1/KNR4 family protein [Lentibacillus populi]
MNVLPKKLDQVIGEEIYKRDNINKVNDALASLEVDVSDTFREFYNRFAGPFWEEHVPFELLDIVDEESNIKSYTLISRKEHGFPKKFLVLSEMSANAVLVLDTVTDKVYSVNFEGGDELLLKGELKETWSTFYEFLKDYFNC